MVKTILGIVALAIFLVATPTSMAANNQGSGNTNNTNKGSDSGSQNKPQQSNPSSSPSTTPTQNQNQVTTQNKGTTQQVQVKTQETEGTKPVNNVSASASEVAKKVQQLLNAQTSPAGIGDQVREWARTQDQSQLRIQDQLKRLDSKTGINKKLFGPDYKAITELKKELEQNSTQIQQLEELKLKLTDSEELTNVQEMLTLMEQQRTTLQERLTSEESQKGLFGWLVKLFIKQ